MYCFSHCCNFFTGGGFLGIQSVLIVNKALKRPKPRKRAYVSPSVRRQKVSTHRQVSFSCFHFYSNKTHNKSVDFCGLVRKVLLL